MNHFTKYASRLIFSLFLLVLMWILLSLLIHYPIESTLSLPSENQEIELYSNQTGENLQELFSEAIRQAQKSITLSIYSLTDPKIINELQRAIQKKIDVTIVCDANASPYITSHIPSAKIIRRFTKGLMHQKILVIDSQLVLLGSANLTYNSLKIHSNLVIGFKHSSLAQALEKRAQSMTEDGGYTPLPCLTTTLKGQHLEIWSLPDNPRGSEHIKELLRTAKKTIQVAMFTFTRFDFAEELIRASKRGVKVNVVIDRTSGSGVSYKVASLLDSKKLGVSLSTGNKLLHHKLALIDDEILINGSANWTKAAFQENDDYFIVLYPLTPSQQSKMTRLFNVINTESKTLEKTKKEKIQKRFPPNWF